MMMMMIKKKRGRPTNSPKYKIERFRVDDELAKKIDFCSKTLNLNKSEVIRKGIELLYKKTINDLESNN
jgi:predicted DNA-binding protein